MPNVFSSAFLDYSSLSAQFLQNRQGSTCCAGCDSCWCNLGPCQKCTYPDGRRSCCSCARRRNSETSADYNDIVSGPLSNTALAEPSTNSLFGPINNAAISGPVASFGPPDDYSALSGLSRNEPNWTALLDPKNLNAPIPPNIADCNRQCGCSHSKCYCTCRPKPCWGQSCCERCSELFIPGSRNSETSDNNDIVPGPLSNTALAEPSTNPLFGPINNAAISGPAASLGPPDAYSAWSGLSRKDPIDPNWPPPPPQVAACNKQCGCYSYRCYCQCRPKPCWGKSCCASCAFRK